MAALTAFILSLIFGPLLIRKLKELKIGEKITKQDSLRLDELHNHKKDTPTMGGILIIGTILVSTLLWADITNRFIIVVVFSMAWLGVTGFMDDYLKQIKKRAKGLSPVTPSQAIEKITTIIKRLVISAQSRVETSIVPIIKIPPIVGVSFL